jgi:hypothetical protein
VLAQVVVGLVGILVVAAVVLTALAPVYPPRHRAEKLYADRLRPPAPAPTATARPGASASPDSDPGQFPTDLIGTWTGSVNQKDPAHDFDSTYDVSLVLRGGTTGQVIGTSSYPTIPCSGDLVMTAGGANVQVTEHIVAGTQCTDTKLSLRLDGSGNLIYHFDDVGDGTGDGVLTKQR